MRIESLKYFVEIVKQGSINSTAKTLYISQQALSQALANIEKEVACTLFERSKRGVVLTDKGKLFYDMAIVVLDAWNNCIAKISQDILNGKLRYSVDPIVEGYYYAVLLEFIQRNELNVQLHKIPYDFDKNVYSLEHDTMDFCVTSISKDGVDAFLEQHPLLSFNRIKEYRASIMVSKNSLLSKKSCLSFADIKDHICIVENSSEVNGLFFTELLERLPLLDVIFTDSYETKQFLVAKNVGFALGIENLPANRNMQNIVEFPVKSLTPILLGVLYNKNKQETINILIDLFR